MKYFLNAQQRKATHSSCFLEFMMGEYNGNCWLDNSLNICDDLFNSLDLYSFLKKADINFDYYGITTVDKKQWNSLLNTCKNANYEIEIFFAELSPWVDECFKEYNVFTILGI